MATTLTGPTMVVSADLLTNSSVNPGQSIGSYVETANGRGFRFCKNGAVATVAGKVYQGPALDATNHQPSGGLTPAAAAIGDTTITISTSTTQVLNELAGGVLSVVVTPGQGYTYAIRGNTAVSGAAGAVITLDDPLQVALTTSSRVIAVKSKYNGVVIEPGTPTAAIAGVPNSIITAAYFGWLQTRGPCAVLFTGTGAAGKAVGSLSGGTSGSMAPCIAATNIGGYHMATGITAEYSIIDLNIG